VRPVSPLKESTISTAAGEVQIRRALPEEVIDLRHAILRAGLPRDTAIFPGDDHADARHVVAVTGDGRIIGCATAHPSTWDNAPAWQIRGMATDPAFRGAGIGRAMLGLLEKTIRDETTIRQMWCYARVSAMAFYERAGWRSISDPFEIPTAGPHMRMVKSITDCSR
jgi:GNAT superfamily N-acetyltransferase